MQGFIPGRAAHAITLEDVLAVFRATDIEIAHGVTSQALQDLVTEIDEMRQRRIAGVTIADLMPSRASAEPLSAWSLTRQS